MHRKAATGIALVAIALAGCVQTFGEGGSLDRALAKDEKNLLDVSPSGQLYTRYCAGGREHTESCRWALANPKKAAALMLEEEE